MEIEAFSFSPLCKKGVITLCREAAGRDGRSQCSVRRPFSLRWPPERSGRQVPASTSAALRLWLGGMRVPRLHPQVQPCILFTQLPP